MKTYFSILIFFIGCSAFVIDSVTQKAGVFEQLYILEGKWIMKTKKGAIGEEWIKISKDYLQNRGYLINGTDTVITERVALTNTKDGIFYTSTVEEQNNRGPIAFRLSSSDNNTFVFENPTHDYPKKISYKLVNKDSIYAWIDDGKSIPEKRSGFAYSRQK